jgi:Zn finger protein HypA/HybF involved in hydrogenase expression
MSECTADHSVVFYRNGEGTWAEFECGKCKIDMDFFYADLIEIDQAVTDKTDFECPSCHAVRPIQNLTEPQNS